MDYSRLYAQEAKQYEELIGFEDAQGNLPRYLKTASKGLEYCLDCGTGTGRLARILAGLGKKVVGYDSSSSMLSRLPSELLPRSLVADHLNLPFAGPTFDLITAGWTFCHLVDAQPHSWKTPLNLLFRHLFSILKTDGKIIVVETLGTGTPIPNPPAHLIEYQNHLQQMGFQKDWIRTDYEFPDLKTARRLSAFFFSESMEKNIDSGPPAQLKECTGIWTCSKESLS